MATKNTKDTEMAKRAANVIRKLAMLGMPGVKMPQTIIELSRLEKKAQTLQAKKSTPAMKKSAPPKPMAKPATGGTVALKKGGYVTKKGNFTKKGPCK
jgi:hypothetical protein